MSRNTWHRQPTKKELLMQQIADEMRQEKQRKMEEYQQLKLEKYKLIQEQARRRRERAGKRGYYVEQNDATAS